MGYQITKSFASEKSYVQLQGKIVDGVLHVQGSGPESNRDYGIAVDIKVTPELANWLGTLPRTLDSFVTSSHYFPIQARYRAENGTINFQAKAYNTYNRPYGGAFEVPVADALRLALWLSEA